MARLEEKLDFYIDNKLNVLLEGHAGVGKTALVIEAFERKGLKWRYYSTSTMDPWVDFIGVPKERQDETTGQSYLDLVRPRDFANDDIEAIFLDEMNRSPKKVRNAVMELIQFKSINGKKFNNLKIIWAAINPDDDENDNEDSSYDVEPLDPAQKDRFHAHILIPYSPSLDYFKNKFGSEIAKSAITWWKDLDEKTQFLVSPRRLDYALEIHKLGGDVRDIIPKQANVSKLKTSLQLGPTDNILRDFINNDKTDEAREWLSVENNYTLVIESIKRQKKYREYFLPLLPLEKISLLMESSSPCFNFLVKQAKKDDKICKLFIDILNSNQNNKLRRKINKAIDKHAVLKNKIYAGHKEEGSLLNEILTLSKNCHTTQERIKLVGLCGDYLVGVDDKDPHIDTVTLKVNMVINRSNFATLKRKPVVGKTQGKLHKNISRFFELLKKVKGDDVLKYTKTHITRFSNDQVVSIFEPYLKNKVKV